jgi:hypothetical protein
MGRSVRPTDWLTVWHARIRTDSAGQKRGPGNLEGAHGA